jgi:hypothetical protein
MIGGYVASTSPNAAIRFSEPNQGSEVASLRDLHRCTFGQKHAHHSICRDLVPPVPWAYRDNQRLVMASPSTTTSTLPVVKDPSPTPEYLPEDRTTLPRLEHDEEFYFHSVVFQVRRLSWAFSPLNA